VTGPFFKTNRHSESRFGKQETMSQESFEQSSAKGILSAQHPTTPKKI
jgi:hypothetical protein